MSPDDGELVCPGCQGARWVDEDECPECEGDGTIPAELAPFYGPEVER